MILLKIKDIPVFYFPYVTYPLSDKRKTGLLFPTYKNASNNGLTSDFWVQYCGAWVAPAVCGSPGCCGHFSGLVEAR